MFKQRDDDVLAARADWRGCFERLSHLYIGQQESKQWRIFIVSILIPRRYFWLSAHVGLIAMRAYSERDRIFGVMALKFFPVASETWVLMDSSI